MSHRGTKVYVGNLSRYVRRRDLERLFDKYGYVEDVQLNGHYAFVTYEDYRDAEDAVHYLNHYELEGDRISVQFAKTPTQRGGRRRDLFRIEVDNLGSRTSWQDLKDFARRAGQSVEYTDVDRSRGTGVIEYRDRADYREALRTLDDVELDGHRLRLRGMSDDARSRSRSRSRGRKSGRSRSRSHSRSRSRSPKGRGSSPPRDRSRSRSRSHSRSRSRSKSPARDSAPTGDENAASSSAMDSAASSGDANAGSAAESSADAPVSEE